MTNIERHTLLQEYLEGKEKSFNLFFNDVKKPVFFNIYSYVKSYEISEDLLQETFLELLKNTKKIKKSEDLLGYLIVISKNKALNYIKKNKRIITESDLENTETI